MRRCLEAGSDEVWVAYPGYRAVHQYRRDEPGLIRTYREGEQIDTSRILPGLTLAVRDIFQVEDEDA